MKPILLEFNSPHFLQTAYQRGVSCEDAIFATQEAALKVLREGGKAFLSLFDLEKAFDTIEKAVLLQCLYNKGICGRAWRIINSWYTSATAAIEIENTVSDLFQQERGVRQGSVLSPTLFQLRAFTSALQPMLMTSDPCHRLDQPLKVKLLPWLISPQTMAYRSMQARQRSLLSLRPTIPQTSLFQLQATK